MAELLELLSIPYEYWIMLLRAALFLTDTYAIAIATVLGMYLVNRHGFLQAFIVAMIGAFICQFVKSIYQIPLNPAVGHVGWAYPSGHTVFNLCFWLSVMWHVRSILLAILLTILFSLSATGMVTMQYHTWDDILGGVYIALPLSFFYMFLDRKTHATPLTVITLLGISIALLCWVRLIKFEFMYYLGIYFGIYVTILLLILWENMLNKDVYEAKNKTKNRILAAIATIISVGIAAYPVEQTFVAKFMQGFAISLVVIFIVPISSKAIDKLRGKPYA